MKLDTAKLLLNISASIDVTSFLSYRDYLREVYSAVKKEVKKESSNRYSYLQFAEDLGFAKSNVIRLVIIGQRPLSLKASKKIEKALGLRGSARLYFENLVKHSGARSVSDRDKYFKKLVEQKQKAAGSEIDRDLLQYFSHWLNPVVRESFLMPSLNGDAEKIKQRLSANVRLEEIKAAIELLIKLGMVEQSESGKLRPVDESVETARTVSSISIVNYHRQMIELAKQSITAVPESRREILALTLRLTEENAAVAKELFHEVIQKIHKLETSHGGEVYQVNTQIFPFFK